MVREKLVKSGNIPPEKLHTRALLFVKATNQSQAVDLILPLLTEPELAVYKRGRNSKSAAPKSASTRDYKRATGLECLFGYLYLSEQKNRLAELFDVIFLRGCEWDSSQGEADAAPPCTPRSPRG